MVIPHWEKGHYFNSIFQEHRFESFQYSPPGDKEDAQSCDTEPPERLLVDSGTSIYGGLRPLPGLLREHRSFKSLKINWRISK